MLRVATVNVNGIRAAYRKGMGDWLDGRSIDVVAIQEVRATRDEFEPLIGDGWHLLHDEATTRGRAGVAIASREPALAHRTTFGSDDFDSAGRWLEADFEVGGQPVTIVSTYVHSGEAGTPKQVEKYRFLDALLERLPELRKRSPLAVFLGDLNVGHRTLDIKNWRGNVKTAGFLPDERAYFDRILGAEGEPGYNTGEAGLGWVDLGRRFAGEVAGPYTWWSARGQAFDNDTGWRIDYQIATPELAAKAVSCTVDRYPSYGARWSDHAPVVVDYDL